jgi:hypothetical protein
MGNSLWAGTAFRAKTMGLCLGRRDATFESWVRRGCDKKILIERARAADQFPASAGSNTISAATHRAIQIRKFLASASSVVFMVHLLEFMMTMEPANLLPLG